MICGAGESGHGGGRRRGVGATGGGRHLNGETGTGEDVFQLGVGSGAAGDVADELLKHLLAGSAAIDLLLLLLEFNLQVLVGFSEEHAKDGKDEACCADDEEGIELNWFHD